MTGFLEEVARDLHARYGEELSERTVLFPSRRARLFFTDALSRIVGRPVWQPAWSTIDELTEEISELRTGDRLRLIAELYKIYSQFHKESFDRFYFWGEMLLADFDTIDKYRIDAAQLFRNLSDLKEIEADISYLTPEQLEIIRNFWSSLGPEADLSEEKRKFLEIWKTLGPIYESYRRRLQKLGIAYGGMVQRVAADRIERGEYAFPEPRRYVVAGFNALSECEKILFRFLATNAETDFYWDYDTYYKDHAEQEAGMFVRRNVELFPPRPGISHDNMSRPKELTVVSAVSNAVQCKYAAEILREYARSGPLDKRTAVVLTDENLLLPLLYALPEEVGKVNVTMGSPHKQSLAYTFVERLVALQAHGRAKGERTLFYHVDAAGLLSHPYVSGSDEKLTRELAEEIVRERRISVDAAWLGRNDLLRRIFRPARTWQELSDWLSEVIGAVARIPYAGDDARRRIEFLAMLAEGIAKLRNSLESCDIAVEIDVYVSLLRRYLQTIRIPFEGEPLEGLQVMGILETRNLDFENVVILSMNDDNFPGNRMAQASFVPYNLRAAFELPTPEHHEGVYAYYFYRLIQRARRVHMLYCSHADDKSTGEPSRYIYQLDYESGIPVQRVEVGVDVHLARTAPIEVAKDPQTMARLERFVDPESKATLSPTAFFRYVACPLRFYFHSVARLAAENEVAEEVDAPMFGTILHAAAQKLYGRIVGESHPGATLQALRRTDEAAGAVVGAINLHYLRDEQATPADYTGNLLLVKDIVTRYLRGGVMRYDAAHD
ncbi:MAG: PD-(D/E)XK nuclease family protein, partial [Alistipes sp.]|nr:PD-(D/E)XK nuclease family protein [Alistipes sp.]